MPEGESIVLAHLNDPVPLHKLFEKELPGKFEWSYLKKGPDVFEVSIRKIKRDDFTVNELMERFPAAAHVLTRYNIKYYLDGKVKVKHMITDPRVKVNDILDEMNALSDHLGFQILFSHGVRNT